MDAMVVLCYSIVLLAPIAVLGWVYLRTRLPAVAAYLIWLLLAGFALPSLQKALVNAVAHGGWTGMTIGRLVMLTALVRSAVGSALLIWMALAFVQWARPGTLFPWRTARVPPAPGAGEESSLPIAPAPGAP